MRPADVRRGQLRRYVRPSVPDNPLVMLIVSSDGINDSPRPTLIGLQVRGTSNGDLLTVEIPDAGYVYAGDPTRIYRAWLGNRLADVDPVVMGRVDVALSAALDL